MKAKITKMFDINQMEKDLYGIQIKDGKNIYYVKDGNTPVVKENKNEIIKIVKELNAKFRVSAV